MRMNHAEQERIAAYWRSQEQDNYRELDAAIHSLPPRRLRRWQRLLIYALYVAGIAQWLHLVYNWLLCR